MNEITEQNPPRLTENDINSVIVGEEYHVFDGILTICCLTLVNGYLVTGESACVSKATFNEERGRNIARDNAKQKIWSLEGYLLKQKLLNTH